MIHAFIARKGKEEYTVRLVGNKIEIEGGISNLGEPLQEFKKVLEKYRRRHYEIEHLVESKPEKKEIKERKPYRYITVMKRKVRIKK